MEINAKGKGNGLYATLLLPVNIGAGVEADSPYPGLDTAFTPELLESLPEVDKNLLEHIVNLFPVVREEVADSVDRLFIFSNHSCEF